eukprot:TRINITY_DN16555_c0_g1_i1.p1 TRINITY_DN16555_c0_g1~~TRINITY_DN16555_c0_g1_i1.p1  ORF type:complete len:453 (-),score=36.33 TRINITY_DN16555_c0_g1_i1:73-1431(-)
MATPLTRPSDIEAVASSFRQSSLNEDDEDTPLCGSASQTAPPSKLRKYDPPPSPLRKVLKTLNAASLSTFHVSQLVLFSLFIAGLALALIIVWELSGYGVGQLRVNNLQMIGTHNSYHAQVDEETLAMAATYIPYRSVSWAMSHRPLPEQLAAGIRFFEIDVYDDPPPGGRFYNRAINKLLGRPTGSNLPELLHMGYKVLHVQDTDFNSTCNTLLSCLRLIKDFSEEHPRHFPIGVRIEVRHLKYEWPPEAVVPANVTLKSLMSLEDEVKGVFHLDNLILPREVIRPSTSNRLFAAKYTWPKLRDSAGKVFFFLTSRLPIEVYALRSLNDRVFFSAYAPEGASDPRIAEHSSFNVVWPETFLPKLVQENAFVFSKADGNTEEARTEDFSRLKRAVENGANVIMTDYPESEAPNPFGTKYVAKLPGGVQARCNPVSAPSWCSRVTWRLKEPIP